MKKIIIMGGYGDGLVVASGIEDLSSVGGAVRIIGFLNDQIPVGSEIEGWPVLGKICEAQGFLCERDIFFITALLKVKENHVRAKKIRNLRLPDERYFTLAHPTAVIARTAKIGQGCYIGPHVTIMPNAVIGNHCSLRASANIGHDCVLGDFWYMGPNSTLAGRSRVADGGHIGPNACVMDRVQIGMYAVVGMGTAVLKDTLDYSIVFGCPARKIGEVTPL